MEEFMRTQLTVPVDMLPENDRHCFICTLGYEKPEPESGVTECAVRLNECGHVFGQSCLGKWLADRNTCPLCRRVLFEMSPEEGEELEEEWGLEDGVWDPQEGAWTFRDPGGDVEVSETPELTQAELDEQAPFGQDFGGETVSNEVLMHLLEMAALGHEADETLFTWLENSTSSRAINSVRRRGVLGALTDVALYNRLRSEATSNYITHDASLPALPMLRLYTAALDNIEYDALFDELVRAGAFLVPGMDQEYRTNPLNSDRQIFDDLMDRRARWCSERRGWFFLQSVLPIAFGNVVIPITEEQEVFHQLRNTGAFETPGIMSHSWFVDDSLAPWTDFDIYLGLLEHDTTWSYHHQVWVRADGLIAFGDVPR